MSWLYSRALVEAFSEVTCSDGAASALSSGTPMPRAFLPPDKTTAFSRPSRFGMTFGPLTDDLGEELLTWFLADSRARTSALPETVPDSRASDPACGRKWRGSLARFNPATSSWKTAQPSLLGGSDEFAETWPRWGTTVAGELYLLPTPGHLIGGSASGLWLTPCAMDAKPITGGDLYLTETGSVRHMRPDGKSSNRGLSTQVQWPTPTVCGNYNRKGASKTSGDGLATAVMTWPTPTACMSKGSSPASLTRKSGRSREGDRLDHAVMARSGGSLNPAWVEWLMGWPLGWTDLQPLATDKYRSVRRLHGESSEAA